MARRAKPKKGEAEAKRPLAGKTPKDDGARVRDLEKRLAEALAVKTEALKREAEALEQQAATAEILRVIANSLTDVQPVLDAVAERAARLCESSDAELFRRDGARLLLVAHHGPIPSRTLVVPLVRETFNGRTVLDGRTLHVVDLQSETDEFPRGSEIARQHGTRAQLSVPLMHEGVAIGTISLRRPEARLFTERQVALLQTFADQAVIAIENVRLFTELQSSNRELRAALDQQTATAEILRVISGSPTAVEPVFQAIVQSGLRLLGGYSAILLLVRDDQFHLAAFTSTGPQGDSSVARLFPVLVAVEPLLERTVRERRPVVVEDVETEPGFTDAMRQMIRARGWRSSLQMPMVRDSDVVGLVAVTRRKPGRFAADEMALLETFAAQAVIAIENAHLFTELQASNRELTTALDTQTATSDILRVISRSQTDVQPVFDAIVTNAARLCEASQTAVCLARDGLLHLDALHHVWMTAEGLEGLQRRFPMPIGPLIARTLRGETFHIADITHNSAAPEGMKTLARHGGYESMVWVPLMRGEEGLGLLSVVRATPRPFDENQIAVLRNFADQAVIAIENVRLFNELQQKNEALTQAHAQVTESLEQQTATAEILRVISSTHADAQPVFDTIVQSAVRLCNAANAAVFLTDGRMVYHPANYGSAPEALAAVRAQFPRPLDRSTAPGMAILTRSVVQVPDIEDPSALEAVRQGGRLLGFRSVIMVPMLRESEPVGALGVARREPGQFSDAEVGLLTTFADQAVIAIENVRLFRELEARNQDLTESLERQTATAEILSVISASPTDLRPVFDAILQSALRLCRAVNGGIWRLETGVLSPVAFAGSRSPEWDALARGIEPIAPRREMVSGWAVLEGQVLSVPDIEADDRFPNAQRLARTMGIRSVLGVPMLREGVAVGAMVLNKMEPAGFGERQIDLVRTFADQAVIAIENVRLFKELEARNRDLTEALTRQTATSEILRVISSSPTDAQPVFDAIARNAVVLCGGIRALVLRFDGERLHVAGHYNMSLDVVDRVGQAFPRHPGREYPPDQALLDRSVVHVPDLQAATEFAASTAWQRGVRSLLAVPLLREQEAVGVISLARDVVGPFSPPQIEVLQTFADQAVIAIENVRLFNELEAANRGLRSASQHKSEFLANMSHELRTPLNAVIGFSEVLTERMFGELNEKQDEYLRDIYASGQHLLSLINDILDLSKIEAGRMELELADFHLPSAVENALILVRERASRRGIALGHTIDSGLGMVRADERKVKQVLLNLLSNALKFTPEGGRIDVRAGLRDDLAEISVADTGVGIAPEDQEAVFEEFRQVGTAAKKVEGTGLGLALSRKFVELHGGRIWVRSQVGEGSTFTFTLPVRREEMGA